MPHRLTPLAVVAETDSDGIAHVEIQIPGAFAGLGDPTKGRFLKQAEIWSDDGLPGDRVYNLRVEDKDRLIATSLGAPGEPLSDAAVRVAVGLPHYPVVEYFQDQEAVETDNLKRGAWLTREKLLLHSVDSEGKPQFRFVASGLWICGTFVTGATSDKAGRKARANYIMTTYTAEAPGTVL